MEEETDEESEQEDDCESVSSPEFIRRAMELGFTVPELLQAENEMPSPTSQVPIVEGSIAAKILNTMVKHASSKPARRPWRGPLPPPRVSPKRTLGDAIEAAMVCPGSSSRSWISGSSPTASTGRSRRSPEMAQVINSRSLFFGSGHSLKISKLKNNPIPGSGVGPSDLDFRLNACTKRMGRQMRHQNHLPKLQLEIAVAKRRTAIDVSQKAMFERTVMLICIVRSVIVLSTSHPDAQNSVEISHVLYPVGMQ